MRENLITLPDRSNDGTRDYKDTRAQWEAFVLYWAGGYSYDGKTIGAWIDPADGKFYRETMHVYRVGCDAVHWQAIVSRTFALFPDQIAFYTRDCGEVTILERAARS